jgi:hypothetical protein
MGEVINAVFGRKPSYGGKARLRRRREALGINDPDRFHFREDLTMDHADPETDTRPSELA